MDVRKQHIEIEHLYLHLRFALVVVSGLSMELKKINAATVNIKEQEKSKYIKFSAMKFSIDQLSLKKY